MREFTDSEIEFIQFFEGNKLKAYKDVAGVWTIGTGHTKNVKAGDIITHEQSISLLQTDLKDSLNRIIRAIHVPISDGEMVALLSQAFNLGSFERLAGYFNANKTVWKQKLLLYCKDINGMQHKGLMIRRIAERLVAENREWRKTSIELQNPNFTIKIIEQKKKEIFPNG